MALDDAIPAAPSPLDTDEIPVVVPATPPRPVWSRTWALGGIAVALSIFEAATGLELLFHYRPALASAYYDLADLAAAGRFGFVRELHRWGSHALLVVVAVHLLRIVATGSYRPPRRFNYHVGVVLGLGIVALAATGFVLTWDADAQWLIRRLAEIAATPAEKTLTAIYALHVGVLPVGGALILVHHLRRARLDAEAAGSSSSGE